MYRVIVLDSIAPEGLELLKNAPHVEYEVRTGLKGDELRAALAEFDGAICRSGVKITAESLAGNRRLKAIVRAGVGTDNIDKGAATRQGIVVMNTPAGNTISTAEHTLALMLALSRNVVPACQAVLDHKWDKSLKRDKYMGTQLAGKTLGVIGLGRIGLTVATRAKAFEMRVVGFDPFLSKERAQALGVELIPTVAELLPLVDYLTVHTPLTEETKHLVGMPQLEVLKPGVRLINCARGGIYDEAALAEGLKTGKIAGVALDVFNTEPCSDSPLFGLPGVVCTPHLGASTEEAQTSVAVEGVGLLIDYLTSGAIRHAVNTPSIDPQRLESLRGYLDVAYRLGLLLSQFAGAPVRSCRLLYRGEVAGKETKLLTAAFASGFLENALEEEVNIINAELLLRERGIEVVEQCNQEMGAFSSSITAEVLTENGPRRAAGTLFGHEMARLVQLNEHRLDAYLDGYLIVFMHRDVPGIIGRVGTVCGDHGVNIAQMAVGRAMPGGEAIGILNVDSLPAEEALREIAAHEAVSNVSVIRMPMAGEYPAWLR